jgi:osmotically-inducible protein OsmY
MKTLLTTLLVVFVLASFGCRSQTASDSTITAKIKSQMATDANTSATRVSVETNRGVVTLSGSVPTPGERDRAEQIAKNTEGVKRVINNVTVNPNADGTTTDGRAQGATNTAGEMLSDTTILTKIKTQLVTEGIVGTNVDVNKGTVVLKGEVDNAQEKAKAEEIAGKTEGVKRVENRLTIKPGR